MLILLSQPLNCCWCKSPDLVPSCFLDSPSEEVLCLGLLWQGSRYRDQAGVNFTKVAHGLYGGGEDRSSYTRSDTCAHHNRVRYLCARGGTLVCCGLLPPCDVSVSFPVGIWSSGGEEGTKWPGFRPQGSSGSCASWDLSSLSCPDCLMVAFTFLRLLFQP